MSEGREAFVTLATNDSYADGAFTLAGSLRSVKTTRELVVLITDGVSDRQRHRLRQLFDVVKLVDPFDSGDEKNLRLLGRPELGITFSKLHCWRLTEFTKCVFMDADTLVLRNVDELFQRDELSAAPDIGWPDCFNTGVFVYAPSLETYRTILAYALQFGSFDGGDQGLLNEVFRDWSTSDIGKHLPFTYNMTATSSYWYAPALKRFAKEVKIVHFIGSIKPWHHNYNAHTGNLELHESTAEGDKRFLMQYLNQWWSTYTTYDNKLVRSDHTETNTSEQLRTGAITQHAWDGLSRATITKEDDSGYAIIQRRMEETISKSRSEKTVSAKRDTADVKFDATTVSKDNVATVGTTKSTLKSIASSHEPVKVAKSITDTGVTDRSSAAKAAAQRSYSVESPSQSTATQTSKTAHKTSSAKPGSGSPATKHVTETATPSSVTTTEHTTSQSGKAAVGSAKTQPSKAAVKSTTAAPTGSSKTTGASTTKPAAGVTSKPAVGVTSKPAAGVTSKPAVGVTSKPAATGSGKPATTATSKPAATGTSKPAATSKSKPSTTGTSKPVITSAGTASKSVASPSAEAGSAKSTAASGAKAAVSKPAASKSAGTASSQPAATTEKPKQKTKKWGLFK